ncbi:TetR/AcrR family transcriptional regulator [Paenibacillus kobensis]|uniref:TetR/AcrR family transcriptional regulator n=1 Tax=Paenibacillus kobensis TaxID=59841 RepID=UPI001FED19EF|nr:TetR/AcrR family transcriptional regulator [Paenibacillus kobensis]
MSPLTEKQLLGRRKARREQIMEAAYRVFAQRGWNRAKMSMIADEAGLSAGQLYRFFESKEELFIALIEVAMEESVNALKTIYQLPGSPYEKLKAFTTSVLEDVKSQYPFMLIQQAHVSDEVPPEVKQMINKYSMDHYVELLLPLFIEGQETQQFVDGDLSILISSFLITLSALATFNMPMADNYRMPEAEMVLRIVAGPKAAAL